MKDNKPVSRPLRYSVKDVAYVARISYERARQAIKRIEWNEGGALVVHNGTHPLVDSAFVDEAVTSGEFYKYVK